MKMLVLTSMFFPVLLTSCNLLDPSGIKAQKEWSAQKERERLEYDRLVEEKQKNRLKKQREEKEQFEASHPEVAISKMNIGSTSFMENQFSAALNSFDFVTRYPEAQTLDNVYVKVGTYNLSAMQIQMAIAGYAYECERISAYNSTDYKKACLSSLIRALNDFSAVLKNKNIPDKTKSTALGQASHRNYIDFAHAARLAKMHARLCQQKANQGYVEMVTVAAPCSGQGDVYNIYAARKMGLI
ncbi:hypothetical protein NJH77_26105 [Serratia fonticola]|uniref:hypothetical protein n=1 Tax=Serratia fonticola TaxID=47917 RepID=UPI002097BEDA|nr:hypothetical protein [Serratia fonticola]MCO7512720.1 hypothetical protein [Serratia fonticola]